MRFIDLFAGIGGFRLGLENCNSRGDSPSTRRKLLQKDTSVWVMR